MRLYVDSCIYLNLWKKEFGPWDEPWWRYAADILACNHEICYSGFILKELKYILGEQFGEKRVIFEQFQKIIATDEDYTHARQLEKENEISFFDCMHIVLAKRSRSVLLPRDKELMHAARSHCEVRLPEEL